ncbi:zinc ribbon domain-containing protein [Streptomyces vinaceus]
MYADPAYTSRHCSQCGHTGRRNRQSQVVSAHQACGPLANADNNASRSIARKDARTQGRNRTDREPRTTRPCHPKWGPGRRSQPSSQSGSPKPSPSGNGSRWLRTSRRSQTGRRPVREPAEPLPRRRVRVTPHPLAGFHLRLSPLRKAEITRPKMSCP